MFDTITYEKGGSVLRMIVGVFGEEKFREGLRNYMKKFAYSNAKTADLISSLSLSIGRDLKPLLSNWIESAGYPLLSISSQSDGKLTLTQQRYLIINSTDTNGTSSTTIESRWWIPVKIHSNSETKTIEFDTSSTTTSIKLEGNDYWIKANYGQTGYYRVHYDSNLFRRVSNALIAGQIINVADRSGLINDALSLSRSGHVKLADALSMCLSLHNETEYAVWATAIGHLDLIARMLWTEDCHQSDFDYMRYLLISAVDQIGWMPSPDDSHPKSMLRAVIFQSAVYYGVESVVATGLWLFDKFVLKEEIVIPGDLRPAVYQAGIRYGPRSNFYHLYEHYLADGDSQSEQRRILAALAKTTELDLLGFLLRISIDPNIVRAQGLIFFNFFNFQN